MDAPLSPPPGASSSSSSLASERAPDAATGAPRVPPTLATDSAMAPAPDLSDLPTVASPGMKPAEASQDDLSELMPKIQLMATASYNSEHNAMPTVVPAPQKQFFGVLGQRHVICISGLPNNGKKFVARELGWYLEFFYGTKVAYFQVEDYANGGTREERALQLLEDVQCFLRKAGGISRGGAGEGEGDLRRREHTDSGRVAIVLPPKMAALAAMDDASAKEAWTSTWSCTSAVDRKWIRKRLADAGEDYKLMFLEIELTDRALLRQHDAVLTAAQKSHLEGLREWYECSYTPLGRSASSEASLSYLRYRNFRDMETHRMHGYLRMRVAQFLSVLRPWRHTVYLSRHGESTYNVEKKLGGDPALSRAGEAYARRLGTYAERCIQANPHSGRKTASRLWTSSLQRTELTAAHIPHPDVHRDEVENPTDSMEDTPTWKQMRHRVFRNLDEIYAGTFDGMTEQQIAAADSRFGADRKVDKLATRYPHGESYLDIMTRLEPLILELHSYQEPVLIVSHQATLRVLRAYLLRDRTMSRDKCPTVDIPQHTVMKITWDGWNFEVRPSPDEARMRAKQWPPREDERWTAKDADALRALPEPPIGREEWHWLGPDPKRSDGQEKL